MLYQNIIYIGVCTDDGMADKAYISKSDITMLVDEQTPSPAPNMDDLRPDSDGLVIEGNTVEITFDWKISTKLMAVRIVNSDNNVQTFTVEVSGKNYTYTTEEDIQVLKYEYHPIFLLKVYFKVKGVTRSL